MTQLHAVRHSKVFFSSDWINKRASEKNQLIFNLISMLANMSE